jgi:hypothetical protein
MKFDYQTKLVKMNNQLIGFYKYNNNIGFIPADIHFTFRNKIYNTSDMMTLLVLLYKNNKLLQLSKKFTIDNWYTKNIFNKKLFILFYNELKSNHT